MFWRIQFSGPTMTMKMSAVIKNIAINPR